jgi:hypothetical protein
MIACSDNSRLMLMLNQRLPKEGDVLVPRSEPDRAVRDRCAALLRRTLSYHLSQCRVTT